MAEDRISALLIAGPTASGKSHLALRLAERLGGALINADSMQVYRDLPILSARPGATETALAPHLLFGHVDGAINYSVGRYLEDAALALAQARAAGHLPIFVGGTGLYFKALTQGISEMPRVPEAVRAHWRNKAETMPVAALHSELALRDPVMAARLKPSDPQRILRALEVHAATGQSLAVFQATKAKPLLDLARCRAIFLAPERAVLRAAIDQRFDAMVESGAVDEVAALKARGLDPALPAMRALGVPQLLHYLSGVWDLATAAEAAKRDTRAYAKRQFTFARHQLPMFQWMNPATADWPPDAWL
jgi:tRNA dimethylallyltransferase